MKTKKFMQFYSTSVGLMVGYGLMATVDLIRNIVKFGISNLTAPDLLKQNIVIIPIIICIILFLLLAANVKKGKVFSLENEKIINVFFGVLCFVAMIEFIIVHTYTDERLLSFSGIILTLVLAVVLQFFAMIMKIGRTMKEENDQTI